MEGGGEGMVAVVQGMDNSGLTVTLLKGQVYDFPISRQRNIYTHAMALEDVRRAQNMSAAASTDLTTRNASAQMWTDRYVSSYQLAHCNLPSTSSPVSLSEFPRRRNGFSRIQGNFELGGHGPYNVNTSMKSTQSCRDDFWTNKVSRSWHSSSPTNSAAFISSLRRYPSFSADKGNSTEFLQRLLLYTQAKYASKSSQNIRRMRSLVREGNHQETIKALQKDTKIGRPSKSLQTYTRSRSPIPSLKENCVNTTYEMKFEVAKGSKSSRPQSPTDKTIRYKDNQLNETYDYLKSVNMPPRRQGVNGSTEVRYLSDVTRGVRDSIRQIVRDAALSHTVVCPKMRGRCELHQQHYHPKDTADQSTSDSGIEDQGSPVRMSKGSTASQHNIRQNIFPRINQKTSCYCKKRLACDCKQLPSSRRSDALKPELSRSDSLKPELSRSDSPKPEFSRSNADLPVPNKCFCPKLSRDPKKCACKRKSVGYEYANNLEEQLSLWLQEIPVYANESPEDKATRNEMVKNLAEILKKLRGVDDYENKAKDEIRKCLETLPMWCPGDKADQEKFQDQIVNKLMDRLKNVPTGDGDTFDNEISEWIDSINFKRDQPVDKKEIVKNFATILKPLAIDTPANDDDDDKDILKKEIIATLQELPIEDDGDIAGTVKRLASDLVNRLQKRKSSDSIYKSYFDSRSSLSEKDMEEVLKLAKVVAEIITDPNLQSMEKENKIKHEILERIKKLPLKTTASQDDLGNQLTNRFENPALIASTPKSEKSIGLFFPNGGTRTMSSLSEKDEEVVALTKTVTDIITDPNLQPMEKENKMKHEISEGIKKLPPKTKASREDLGNQLTSRLQNPALIASTPKSEKFNLPFSPNGGTSTISSINVDNDDDMKTKEQLYIEELTQVASSWVTELLKDLKANDDEGFKETMVQDLVDDIVDRQRYLQLNPGVKTSDEEELKHLNYQLFKWLNKLPDLQDFIDIKSKAQSLMDRLKNISAPPLIKSSGKQEDIGQKAIGRDSLQDAIIQWSQKLPTQNGRTFEDIKKVMDKLTTAIGDLLVKFDEESLDSSKSNMVDKKEKYLRMLPSQLKKKGFNDQFAEQVYDIIKTTVQDLNKQKPVPDLNKQTTVQDLNKQKTVQDLNKQTTVPDLNKQTTVQDLNKQKTVQDLNKQTTVPDLNKQTDSSVLPHKSRADALYEDIESWCDELFANIGKTTKEQEAAKSMKENLAKKLILKIGELNMDPATFNDDFIYEDLLKDEIEQLMGTLALNPEQESLLPTLKQKLIEKVKDARQKTLDETAGQNYRLNLRDTIFNNLPKLSTFKELSPEEEASFEVLKESLADAFINWNYSVDADQKNKLKQKIQNEIDRFCSDYLNRVPATPLDSTTLNQNLFDALQKVAPPDNAKMESEVKQVRMKDEISEWLKELPLKGESKLEELQRMKMVSVLAKRLNEIEKERENQPEIDFEDSIKTEILKWLKKIKGISQSDITQMTEKLLNRLKNTEDSRKLEPSKGAKSDESLEENICSYYKYLSEKQKAGCSSPCLQCPLSTLSTEDRAHLEEVRERTKPPRPQTESLLKRCPTSIDASVNPPPTDIGSQTKINFQCDCYERNKQQPTSFERSASKSNQLDAPITPNVNVKEYHWDSTDISTEDTRYQTRSPYGTPIPSSRSQQRTQRMGPQSFSQTPYPCSPCNQEGQSRQYSSQYMPPQNSPQDMSPQSSSSRMSSQRIKCPGINIRGSFRCPPEQRASMTGPRSREEEQPVYSRDSRNLEAPKMSREQRPAEDFDWSTMRFPEDTNWHMPCSKRALLFSDEDFEPPSIKVRVRREERTKCKCRERVMTKCNVKRARASCYQPPSDFCDDDALRQCPRCCGLHCPYPSFLYFG